MKRTQNATVAMSRTASPMSSGLNHGFTIQKSRTAAMIPSVATSCRLPDISVLRTERRRSPGWDDPPPSRAWRCDGDLGGSNGPSSRADRSHRGRSDPTATPTRRTIRPPTTDRPVADIERVVEMRPDAYTPPSRGHRDAPARRARRRRRRPTIRWRRSRPPSAPGSRARSRRRRRPRPRAGRRSQRPPHADPRPDRQRQDPRRVPLDAGSAGRVAAPPGARRRRPGHASASSTSARSRR